MIIIYDPKSGEIVGHASRVFDGGKWREPTADEICPDYLDRKLETIHLKDEPRFLAFGADQYRLRRDENGAVTGIEVSTKIALSCDAPDRDKDGIPDLPADGTSTTQVTAALDGAKADVDVTFRTTRGSLSKRTVKTSADGKATVTLRAASETVTVDINATAPGYRPGTLRLEFLPLE
ncbi:MAG TPA: Ig-like domain-containing protein [Isosphaeraceae bacterium]|jgi:hypothetical protein|nr:Ig-like domain-containing protein [Isosphaeraceae bacterium]